MTVLVRETGRRIGPDERYGGDAECAESQIGLCVEYAASRFCDQMLWAQRQRHGSRSYSVR